VGAVVTLGAEFSINPPHTFSASLIISILHCKYFIDNNSCNAVLCKAILHYLTAGHDTVCRVGLLYWFVTVCNNMEC
jgi:hypothetical protein